MLRRGERVTVEPQYFQDANLRVKQLEVIQERNEPKHRAVIPGAPLTKKAEPTASVPPSPLLEQDAPLTDGKEKPSAVLPPARPSRRKTSRTSAGNAG